ncbi:MAG: hypothetical protein JSS27_19090 [Planctomycetes bacterium]|nr:hypothetical protein [Planctomycetota bacterium]
MSVGAFFKLVMLIAVALGAIQFFAPQRMARFTRSPWFYFAMFSLMGVVSLVVIGPKYLESEQRRIQMRKVQEAVAVANLAQPGQESPPNIAPPADPTPLIQNTYFGLLLIVVVVTAVFVTLSVRSALNDDAHPPTSEPTGDQPPTTSTTQP